ncbi:hypothetical protein MTR67_022445 [Solanum verrucosum]|uniref:Uncharacterized protein n=1 Tax=Solanum verrucosum TaxID=315347 RepID=A0AAF0QUP0_SOLVR|nr:hypothetical protein MTR67_022445 [Solanum verrucosum]
MRKNVGQKAQASPQALIDPLVENITNMEVRLAFQVLSQAVTAQANREMVVHVNPNVEEEYLCMDSTGKKKNLKKVRVIDVCLDIGELELRRWETKMSPYPNEEGEDEEVTTEVDVEEQKDDDSKTTVASTSKHEHY